MKFRALNNNYHSDSTVRDLTVRELDGIPLVRVYPLAPERRRNRSTSQVAKAQPCKRQKQQLLGSCETCPQKKSRNQEGACKIQYNTKPAPSAATRVPLSMLPTSTPQSATNSQSNLPKPQENAPTQPQCKKTTGVGIASRTSTNRKQSVNSKKLLPETKNGGETTPVPPAKKEDDGEEPLLLLTNEPWTEGLRSELLQNPKPAHALRNAAAAGPAEDANRQTNTSVDKLAALAAADVANMSGAGTSDAEELPPPAISQQKSTEQNRNHSTQRPKKLVVKKDALTILISSSSKSALENVYSLAPSTAAVSQAQHDKEPPKETTRTKKEDGPLVMMEEETPKSQSLPQPQPFASKNDSAGTNNPNHMLESVSPNPHMVDKDSKKDVDDSATQQTEEFLFSPPEKSALSLLLLAQVAQQQNASSNRLAIPGSHDKDTAREQSGFELPKSPSTTPPPEKSSKRDHPCEDPAPDSSGHHMAKSSLSFGFEDESNVFDSDVSNESIEKPPVPMKRQCSNLEPLQTTPKTVVDHHPKDKETKSSSTENRCGMPFAPSLEQATTLGSLQTSETFQKKPQNEGMWENQFAQADMRETVLFHEDRVEGFADDPGRSDPDALKEISGTEEKTFRVSFSEPVLPLSEHKNRDKKKRKRNKADKKERKARKKEKKEKKRQLEQSGQLQQQQTQNNGTEFQPDHVRTETNAVQADKLDEELKWSRSSLLSRKTASSTVGIQKSPRTKTKKRLTKDGETGNHAENTRSTTTKPFQKTKSSAEDFEGHPTLGLVRADGFFKPEENKVDKENCMTGPPGKAQNSKPARSVTGRIIGSERLGIVPRAKQPKAIHEGQGSQAKEVRASAAKSEKHCFPTLKYATKQSVGEPTVKKPARFGANLFPPSPKEEEASQCSDNCFSAVKTKPPINVVCTESFLEQWSDTVAALASGKHSEHDVDLNEMTQPVGRKVTLVDTPLLELSSVDMEFPGRCALLVIKLSDIEKEEHAREITLSVARISATTRYLDLFITFVHDTGIDAAIQKHIFQLQSSVLSHWGGEHFTNLHFKSATPQSLAGSISEIATKHGDNDETAVLAEILQHDELVERARFLLNLLPCLSLHGAALCLKASNFGELCYDLHALQKVMLAATAANHGSLHPGAILQLSEMVKVSLCLEPILES